MPPSWVCCPSVIEHLLAAPIGTGGNTIGINIVAGRSAADGQTAKLLSGHPPRVR
jgi:hypothetical protein